MLLEFGGFHRNDNSYDDERPTRKFLNVLLAY